MGIFDKAKDALTNNQDKIDDARAQYGDKIDQGIDRASQEANTRTGGKYEDQINQGADQVRDRIGSERPDADAAQGDPQQQEAPDAKNALGQKGEGDPL
ncbi:antitoxin [Ornithinimicrobium sp. Y1847]|uniref:antitoxin n=1 Tax=unclassified Ornithinimicrobium TaxID=2615080 RepID=UPI003B677EBE